MTTQPHATRRGCLAAHVERETSVRAADCYQCGKCSAGCPVASEMDEPPSRLLHLLQLGTPQHDERLLRSRAIWLCLGCETCVTRCPQEVDLPHAMDALRREAVARGLAHRDAADILAFHRAFLGAVARHGRLFELRMILEYKLRTGHLLQDMTIAPAMYQKGKVGLLPHSVRDTRAIGRLFRRAREEEREVSPPARAKGGERA